MDKKYYLRTLSDEELDNVKKDYGVIKEPKFDESGKTLTFKLFCADRNGGYYFASVNNKKEIKSLLSETKSKQSSDLEGKVIEVYYTKTTRILQSISVNKNLI